MATVKKTKKRAKKRPLPPGSIKGMSGWLVLRHQTMDDFPVGLYETYIEARYVAQNISQKSCDMRNKAMEHRPFEQSTHVCFSVVEMVNGKPVYRELVFRKDDA